MVAPRVDDSASRQVPAGRRGPRTRHGPRRTLNHPRSAQHASFRHRSQDVLARQEITHITRVMPTAPRAIYRRLSYGAVVQHGSSTGFRRAAAVSGRPAYVAEHGGAPRKAPQTPGISCRQSIARRYIGGTFSLTCQGTPPVRQWRTGGLHTGPTPRNAHGTLLAAVVPTRRRHGPDRPYHANGGKPAAVISAAPWCPARGHYMEDVRVGQAGCAEAGQYLAGSRRAPQLAGSNAGKVQVPSSISVRGRYIRTV